MKKIIIILFISIIACAAIWNTNRRNKDTSLSDIALNNVEALAYIPPIYLLYGEVYHVLQPGSDGKPLHSYNCIGEGNYKCGPLK